MTLDLARHYKEDDLEQCWEIAASFAKRATTDPAAFLEVLRTATGAPEVDGMAIVLGGQRLEFRESMHLYAMRSACLAWVRLNAT